MYSWNFKDENKNTSYSTSPTSTGRRTPEGDTSDSEDEGNLDPNSRRGRPRADVITSLIFKGAVSMSQIRCNTCNRVFPREKSLQAHMRTHTGERPYGCDYPGCGKSFCQSGQLKTHQRLHTGEKPFVCSVEGCESTFTHANRHCQDHPYGTLQRVDPQKTINDIQKMITQESNAEIREWLAKQSAAKEDRVYSRSGSRPVKKVRKMSDDDSKGHFTEFTIKQEYIEDETPQPTERLPSIDTLQKVAGRGDKLTTYHQGIEGLRSSHPMVTFDSGHHLEMTNGHRMQNGHSHSMNGHHLSVSSDMQMSNHSDVHVMRYHDTVMHNSYDMTISHMNGLNNMSHLNGEMMMASSPYDMPPLIDTRSDGRDYVELQPLTPVPFNQLQPVDLDHEYHTTDGYQPIHIDEDFQKETHEMTLSEQTDKWISALALVELAHGMA